MTQKWKRNWTSTKKRKKNITTI